MAVRPRLLPVSDAQAQMLAGVRPLAPETVALSQAHGRVLARDLVAVRDQPPFAASAMDGFAARSADIESVPVTLKIVGESVAGRRYGNPLGAGEAVRIFTGAPVPDGADCIVIQENTSRPDDHTVQVEQTARAGQFIRQAGLDFASGDAVLAAGTRLQARHIAVAASANASRLEVHKRPVVAVLGTGNELVLPGGTPGPDQIISSNSASLCAAITGFGGSPRDLGIARDDVADIMRAIDAAADADVLVTIGGASVGEHDLVQAALAKAGIALDFWRIAMRPGKPLMFARRGAQRIVGLPGNPVSALVCARIFLKPVVAALSGNTAAELSRSARLASALPGNDERQDYLRASVASDAAGNWTVTPFERQDSSMQNLLARANCLIVRPPLAPAAEPGQPVPILLLDF